MHLKHYNFDARACTHGAQAWKNCFREQRRGNNEWKWLNAAHGTRSVHGPPSEYQTPSSRDQQIPRAPAVHVPASPLQGVMLQVLAKSLQGVSIKMRINTL